MSLAESAGAILSKDRMYRYVLWREVNPAGLGTLCFVMLNPSTANELEDDPTIRRCMGFTRDLGFRRLEVINLCAFRTKSPTRLRQAGLDGLDVVGPEWHKHTYRAILSARRVLVAWGNASLQSSCLWSQREAVVFHARNVGGTLYCLGTTSRGEPRHPLYLPKSAKPEIWQGKT